MLIVVFILVSQAPTLTMAPYLGELKEKYHDMFDCELTLLCLFYNLSVSFSQGGLQDLKIRNKKEIRRFRRD